MENITTANVVVRLLFLILLERSFLLILISSVVARAATATVVVFGIPRAIIYGIDSNLQTVCAHVPENNFSPSIHPLSTTLYSV